MKVTQLPTTQKGVYRQEKTVTIPRQKKKGFELPEFLSRFENDDYILAGIIFVLIFEGCEDYILLAALGYLFLMGFREE